MPGRLINCALDAVFRSSGLSGLGCVKPSRIPCATALALSFSSAVAAAVCCRTCSGLWGLVAQALHPVKRMGTALTASARTMALTRMSVRCRSAAAGLMQSGLRQSRKRRSLGCAWALRELPSRGQTARTGSKPQGRPVARPASGSVGRLTLRSLSPPSTARHHLVPNWLALPHYFA